MKRLSIVTLTMVMVLTLAACSLWNESDSNEREEGNSKISGNGTETDTKLTAKITDIDGTSILLANIGEDASQGDIYRVNANEMDIIGTRGNVQDLNALQEGMIVEVTYDGTIQESYPMGLGGISSISIKEQGEDIVGLYRKVVDDLYEVDSGLNSNIEMIAFDLTQASNLSPAEKSAFICLIGETYKMQTMLGTFEELSQQGYIDKDKLYFEKGLLFTIKDTPIKNGRFSFDAQKWRSGLGAYFFVDCTAKKTSLGWDYTVGSQAIS